jgi:hypothetical protein
MNQTRGTRRQLLDHLRNNGIPIGKSTLDKLCAPSVDQGPPVAAWWGRRAIYDSAQGLAWAERRLSASPSCWRQTAGEAYDRQMEQVEKQRREEATATTSRDPARGGR